jgi:hypothetical protein
MNGRLALFFSLFIFIIGLGVFSFGIYETVKYNSELAARSLTAPETVETPSATQNPTPTPSQQVPLNTHTPSVVATTTPVQPSPQTSPTIAPTQQPTPVPTTSAAGNYKMTQIVTKTPSYQNNMIESKIDGVLSVRTDDTVSLPLTFTITGTAYNVGPAKITVGGSGTGNALGQISSSSKSVSASGTYSINYIVTAAGLSQQTTNSQGTVSLTATCPAPHSQCTGKLKVIDKSGKASEYSFSAKRQ